MAAVRPPRPQSARSFPNCHERSRMGLGLTHPPAATPVSRGGGRMGAKKPPMTRGRCNAMIQRVTRRHSPKARSRQSDMTGMEFSAETWAVKSFIRCCRWPGRMRTLALCQACPAPGVQLPRGTAPHRSRRAVIRRAAGPDVVVIGSGIGGLTAGALCAKYGMSVTVLESHSIPGGAAHSWVHPKVRCA